ncbi:flagellar biosynthesis regulator FlaF [Elioraea sp.]|jgi:flagellar protein FlaF|uniref:flagellar biosynthesis regulator FlaF n=1 Tax=Elioraea sp. TaxID=2185103 RepID=UPI003F700E09
MSLRRYAAVLDAAETPREAEARAFRHVNALLASAADTPSRVAALHKTHQLWGILLAGLIDPGHGLPAELKGRLASLGLWAQRECFVRMGDSGSLEPLMAVHRDMIEALCARPAAPEAGVATASPGQRFVPAVA